jgi:hypothetical protein
VLICSFTLYRVMQTLDRRKNYDILVGTEFCTCSNAQHLKYDLGQVIQPLLSPFPHIEWVQLKKNIPYKHLISLLVRLMISLFL